MAEPSLERVEELFHEAVDLPSSARRTFLDERCAGDTRLRAAVEELLRHDESAAPTRPFLNSPVERLPDGPRALPEVAGYEILAELGRGGMGAVYKARQLDLDRSVALKMLTETPDLSGSFRGRFRTEAEAMARLSHPNIVQIFEIGEQDGRPYFTMEYVAGPSLAAALRGAPQPPEAAAALVESVARAVQFAHDRGVVHRDLKPSNILLDPVLRTGSDKSTADRGEAPAPLDLSLWVPKVADFGLAKHLDRKVGQTQAGSLMGTPSYMSPEQAGAGGPVGPGADVYALGIVLYEMLTGRPPFQAATPLETLRRVTTEEPVSPRVINPRVPRDLVTVCLKCLEKDPRRRYASAADLADDLRRFVAHEPIRARPVGPFGRTWRWARRRPREAALLGVIALLALVLVATAGWYHVRLRAALAETQRLADEQRRRVVELHVTIGLNEAEEGNVAAAALWFAEALRLDQNNPEAVRAHRLRLATTLRQCPSLEGLLAFDEVTLGTHANAGRMLAATAAEGELRVRDVRTGQTLQAGLPTATGVESSSPARAAFSPDGDTLAATGPDGLLSFWDVRTGTARGTAPAGPPVKELAFTPNGRMVAARRADESVLLWDIAARSPTGLPDFPASVLARSALGGDGRWLFAVTPAGQARVWDLADRKPAGASWRLEGHIADAAISADGRVVAVAVDNVVHAYESATGQPAGPDSAEAGDGTHVALSPVGDRMALWSRDQPVRLRRTRTGAPLAALAHGGAVADVAFSDHGRLFAEGGTDNLARVWDAETGDEVCPPLPHNGSVRRVVFADGGRLLTVANDRTVRLWKLPEAPPTLTDGLPAPPEADARSAASSVGRRRVRPVSGKALQVEDAATGAPVGQPLRHSSAIRHVAFNADGSRLVTGSDDDSAQIWDAETGAAVTPPLRHKASVLTAAFSPDGGLVATGGEDRTARVWNVRTGEALTPPLRHRRPVVAVAFEAAGDRLLTRTADGRTHSWDLVDDDRSAETLLLLAEVLSGSRIDEREEAVPLSADELRAAWQRLRETATDVQH